MRKTRASYTVIFLLVSFLLTGKPSFVFSALENSPHSVGIKNTLRETYAEIGIELSFIDYPGLRGLQISNSGINDGEAFRIAGLEKEYPNLIRVPLCLFEEDMYLFTKNFKGEIESWSEIPAHSEIAYIRGIKFIEYAVQNNGLSSTVYSNITQLFKSLDKDRVDFIIASGTNGNKILSENNYTKIRRMKVPVHTVSLYHYIHIKHRHLIPKIRTAFEKLTSDCSNE